VRTAHWISGDHNWKRRLAFCGLGFVFYAVDWYQTTQGFAFGVAFGIWMERGIDEFRN
jgi:hypothetical protein